MSFSTMKVIALLFTLSIASMNIYAADCVSHDGVYIISNCATDINGDACEADTNDYAYCYKCLDGYYPRADNQECKKCTIADCATCKFDNNEQCTSCTDGRGVYPDDKTKCIPCTIDNCIECATDSSSCTKCATGYGFEDDTKSRCLKLSFDYEENKDGAFRLSVISWMILGLVMITEINF